MSVRLEPAPAAVIEKLVKQLQELAVFLDCRNGSFRAALAEPSYRPRRGFWRTVGSAMGALCSKTKPLMQAVSIVGQVTIAAAIGYAAWKLVDSLEVRRTKLRLQRALGKKPDDLVLARRLLFRWSATGPTWRRIRSSTVEAVNQWLAANSSERSIGGIINHEMADPDSGGERPAPVETAVQGGAPVEQCNHHPNGVGSHPIAVGREDVEPVEGESLGVGALGPPPGIGLPPRGPPPPGFGQVDARGIGTGGVPDDDGEQPVGGPRFGPLLDVPGVHDGSAPVVQSAEPVQSTPARRHRPRGQFVARIVDVVRAKRGPPERHTPAAEYAVKEAVIRILADMPEVTHKDKATAIPLIVAAYFVPTATELEARAVLDAPELKFVRQGLDKPA